MMKNKFVIIAIFALIGMSLYALFKYPSQRNNKQLHSDSIGSAYSGIAYRDKREFVGSLDNIFVAKVTNVIGRDYGGKQLETQIIFNIKGKLEGKIIVNDIYNSFNVGNTYLIPARYDEKNNWYVVINGKNNTGNVSLSASIVSDNPNLSYSQLEKLAIDNEQVQEWFIAYVYEIVPDYKVFGAGNTSSFQSLTEIEKQAVLTRIKNLPPPPPPTPPEDSVELCSDKIDNDGDGNTDLQDLNCASFRELFPENTKTQCSDGSDNDNDGFFDLQDSDCAPFAPPPIQPQPTPPPPPPVPPSSPSGSTSTPPVSTSTGQ